MAKKRLQFDFTEEAVAQIDVLAKRIGASTRAEVIRRALLLLETSTAVSIEPVNTSTSV